MAWVCPKGESYLVVLKRGVLVGVGELVLGG